jgi:hypothetical protein
MSSASDGPPKSEARISGERDEPCGPGAGAGAVVIVVVLVVVAEGSEEEGELVDAAELVMPHLRRLFRFLSILDLGRAGIGKAFEVVPLDTGWRGSRCGKCFFF